jgi:hypothetical protein
VEVGLNAVSHKGKHGNSTMLDFGMAKETDGGFTSLLPEVPSRKSKRVVVLDNGVQFSGKSFKVGLEKKNKWELHIETPENL